MKLSYATKANIVRYLSPLVVITVCVFLGYNATRNILAAPVPASGIGVSVGQPQYKVGQDVTVTLSNATPNNVYVTNNCPNEPLAVYKLENNSWVAINAATNISKCADEPRNYEIPADRSIKTDYRYWPGLFAQAGHYRI